MNPLIIDELPEGLRRPILIMAFAGWNDAAEAATTAARYLSQAWSGRKFARIDPEEFYHFGLSRPHVRFKAGSRTEREIIWPATEFSLVRSDRLPRDVIIGVGIEPHLRWKAYCAAFIELARRAQVTLVLTLGALLAEVPHTRPIYLVGGAPDPELAALLGTRPTRYEGPTGIVGVLNTICRDEGLPIASLWANVPHYISGIENPKAALALVKRVLLLLSTDLDLSELEEGAKQLDQNLSEIVSQNSQLAAYVEKLEAKEIEDDEPPAVEPEELPPASELVAEFERFLRQHPPKE